jgi:hypothetical protein
MSAFGSRSGDIAQTLSSIITNRLAHTNLFSIIIPAPAPGGISDLLKFSGKGTQLPSSELGTIEVPYRGRKLKVPGQRTFSEWTVTVMETEGMYVRTALENWMNILDNATTGARNPLVTNAKVSLLKSDMKSPSLTYTLYGVYPTNIASVDLSFDEQTSPLEYSVTFSYSYHTLEGSQQSIAPSQFIA